MNYQHKKPLFENDIETLHFIAGMLRPNARMLHLPLGKARNQGDSSRCTAEAICNVVETCRVRYGTTRFPEIRAEEIYRLAKQLDSYPDHVPGTDLFACAEAYCRIAGGGIMWQQLPNDPQIMIDHMLVEQTGLALTMRWSAQDGIPNEDMLLGGAGLENNKHAVAVCGWSAAHSWNRGTWGRFLSLFGVKSKKQSTAEVLHIEDSDSKDNKRRYYLPTYRKADFVHVVAFWSPKPAFS